MLQTVDWSRTSLHVASVEMAAGSPRRNERVRKLLRARGFGAVGPSYLCQPASPQFTATVDSCRSPQLCVCGGGGMPCAQLVPISSISKCSHEKWVADGML